MAFPNVDVGRIKSQLATVFAAQGHLADVKLRDGTTFQVYITEGFRAPRDLTDGIAQEIHRVKILYDAWQTASPGRPPRKGDQITFLGKRHHVQQSVRARGLGDDTIMYTLEVQG